MPKTHQRLHRLLLHRLQVLLRRITTIITITDIIIATIIITI